VNPRKISVVVVNRNGWRDTVKRMLDEGSAREFEALLALSVSSARGACR